MRWWKRTAAPSIHQGRCRPNVAYAFVDLAHEIDGLRGLACVRFAAPEGPVRIRQSLGADGFANGRPWPSRSADQVPEVRDEVGGVVAEPSLFHLGQRGLIAVRQMALDEKEGVDGGAEEERLSVGGQRDGP